MLKHENGGTKKTHKQPQTHSLTPFPHSLRKPCGHRGLAASRPPDTTWSPSGPPVPPPDPGHPLWRGGLYCHGRHQDGGPGPRWAGVKATVWTRSVCPRKTRPAGTLPPPHGALGGWTTTPRDEGGGTLTTTASMGADQGAGGRVWGMGRLDHG